MQLTETQTAGVDHSAPDPRRWKALGIIAVCQLMIVLDASIVNIALPSAQRSLHISNADRQWVVTAYTLAFGGLLLLGGRISDYVGRKRIFVIGLLGFAASSALGGLAPDSSLLFGARALQGAFAALMAPASLSLLSVTFTEPKERARAFGVYGGIAGGGAAIGLILGGVLTQYTSWRWCLLVNVPVALLAAAAATRVIRESKADGDAHYDIPGAITVTAGLVALVYGFTKAETDGWSSTTTVALLVASAVLLATFFWLERRSTHPLLPVRVLLDRNRGGSFLASLVLGSGLFGMFLFLTYYLQGTLHYSALRSGFAFLPFSAGIVVSAVLAAQLLPKVGPRLIMVVGMVMATAGMVWFTRIGLHTSYITHVLPPEVIMSLGIGLVFVPLSSTALIGVANHDSGVASALVNTTQQVGGSLGTALLNTIAASATTTYLVSHHHATSSAVVHGYDVAFGYAAGLLAIGSVAIALLIRAGRDDLPAESEGVVMV